MGAAGRYIRDRGADRRHRAGDLGIPGARGHAAGRAVRLGVYQREIYGLLQPPAALTGASIQSAGGLAVLKWGVPADLDVRIGGRIVIRHWPRPARPAGQTPSRWMRCRAIPTIAVVSLLSGSYLLRAVDLTGIAGPITVLDSDGAQAIPVVPADLLQADPCFRAIMPGPCRTPAR